MYHSTLGLRVIKKKKKRRVRCKGSAGAGVGQRVGAILAKRFAYRGYSKLRTRTALGPYSRAMPRSIGPPQGRCASLISSNPCRAGDCGCDFWLVWVLTFVVCGLRCLLPDRCRANVAHIRQSRPDSGLGFLANVLKLLKLFSIPSEAEHVQPLEGLTPITVGLTARGGSSWTRSSHRVCVFTCGMCTC